MFEKMLSSEGVRPEKLGYDRPSSKLLGFLAKHYSLKRYVPQSNNFVVFSQYWESAHSGAKTSANGFADPMPLRSQSLKKSEQTHATLSNFYGGQATQPHFAAAPTYTTTYGEFRGNTIGQSHLQSLLKTSDHTKFGATGALVSARALNACVFPTGG